MLSSIGTVSPLNVPPPVPAELIVRLLCGFVAGEEAPMLQVVRPSTHL